MGAGITGEGKRESSSTKWDERKKALSLNRFGLAVILLALSDTLIQEPMLYLCDNL